MTGHKASDYFPAEVFEGFTQTQGKCQGTCGQPRLLPQYRIYHPTNLTDGTLGEIFRWPGTSQRPGDTASVSINRGRLVSGGSMPHPQGLSNNP